MEDGCVECHVPEPLHPENLNSDEKVATTESMTEHLCCDHAFKSGYCICCGEFCGGIEDFDFGNGLCDNCKDSADYDNCDGSDEEE